MKNFAQVRPWLVRWLYLMALVHFVGGLLLPWIASSSLFVSYHQTVLHAFWPDIISGAGRLLQIWWLGLFGVTLQTMAIFMGVLVYIADRQRLKFVWGWILIGFLLWAPQDITLSLQANAWMHVWGDVLALLLLLPPLLLLWRQEPPAV